jgi:hypothetical protein
MHDFIIPSSWPVRRAFAFARAVAPLGMPVVVEDENGAKTAVSDAINWFPGRPDFHVYPPAEDEADISFADGVLRVRM